MRGIGRAIVAGAAASWLALLATPAAAEAAGLECMAASYTAEEKATVERLSADFDIDKDGEGNSASDEIAKMAGKVTKACGQNAGWNDEQLIYAALFEVGRLSEQAFRHSKMMSSAEIQKIDASLAQGNRDNLWTALERAVMGGIAKSKQDASPQDTFAIGAFLLGAGVGTDEKTATNTGVLLGFMALQRLGKREFSALQKGQ
jgi:hypothetical protein